MKYLIQASPDPPLPVRQPEVLTPEVMVFFAFLAFLAIFGFRKVGS